MTGLTPLVSIGTGLGRLIPAHPGRINTAVTGSKHGHDRNRWLPAALVGALVVGGVAGGAIIAATQSSAAPATGAAASSSPLSVCDVTSVANKVIPSVVTISARGSGGSGTGSGEVIRSDGYILTNNHVIAVAASGGSVEVQFSDGQSAPATITGRDPQTDLAVIKVDVSRTLPVIAMGSSSSVQVGEASVVIGAPLGLSGTVTSGIISALDRTIQVPADNDTAALLVSAIQTDAAINPGNSGGAMVNCSGQLIGVPTAGATVPSSSGESSGGSIGLGFAIPVNLAKTIADEIIATGWVTHAYFGLGTVPIPAAAAAQGGVPEGLYVQTVVPGGPSAQAGLRPGDVITQINGEPATSAVQLQELTLTKKPGDTIPLQVWRSGQTRPLPSPWAPSPSRGGGRSSPVRGGPRRGNVGTALFGQPGGEAEQGGVRRDPARDQPLALTEGDRTGDEAGRHEREGRLGEGRVREGVQPHEHQVVGLGQDVLRDLLRALRGHQQVQAELTALGGDPDGVLGRHRDQWIAGSAGQTLWASSITIRTGLRS